MNRILAAMAAFAAVQTLCGDGLAPINPAFLEWRAANARAGAAHAAKGGRATGGSEGVRRSGIVPSPFDRSYLAGFYVDGEAVSPLGQAGKRRLAADSSLPSSYDSRRDGGGLTPVKDQNPYGTCWAHAACGNIEAWLLKAGRGAVDLSENNLANLHGGDWSFSEGGNGDLASAYFLRWGGPVLEASDPYPNEGGSPRNLEPVLHVQNVKWLPSRSSSTDNATIKKAVVRYGAVYASYYHEPSASGGVDLKTKSAYWNPAEGAYYRSAYHESNHAICIVGWDDGYSAGRFSTRPPADGAFLVKNSWGTDFGASGNRGYCWISYYDAGIAVDEVFVFAETEGVDNYDDIYQYDTLGLVGMHGARGGKRSAAAMFVAREDIAPAAVGIYLPEPYAKYDIKVYSGCEAGSPESGVLIGSASGSAGEFAGFQTVPFDVSGTVPKGGRLSAVVAVTTASEYQIAIEFPEYAYSSKATANSGETFYLENGKWKDFTAIKSRTSFCCKLYARRAEAASGTYTVRFAPNGGSGTMADRTYSYGKSYSLPANAFTKQGYVFAGWKWSGGSFGDGAEISFSSAVSSPLVLTAQWEKSASAKPSAPVISEVTQGDLDSISVSWTAVPGAVRYNLYWCAIDEFPSTQTPISVTGTAYLDTERMPGLEIYYWVSAVNDAGESAVSAPVSGYRAATCSVSPASFALPAGGASGSEVWVEANTSWSVLSRDDWISVEDGAGPADGASFRFSVGANPSSSARNGSIVVGTGAVAHRVTRTISVYQAGKSNPLPGVPEMVKALYTSQGFYLAWNAASNAKSYKVYRSQNPDYFGAGETCVASGLKGTSYTDASASWLFAYNYRVAAVNDEGETSGPVVTLQGSLSGGAVVLPSMSSGTFNASGGRASVIVDLIGADEWEAESSAGWLTLSSDTGASGGGFTVTAAENTTSSKRVATVLIGAGYKIGGVYMSSATVTFTQDAGGGSGGSGGDSAQADVTLPASGSRSYCQVTTPKGETWTFLLDSRPSWITGVSHGGGDLTSYSSFSLSSDSGDCTWNLSFTATENTGAEREWAMPIMRGVTFIGAVVVRQKAAGSAEEETDAIPAAGGTKMYPVEYTANEEWMFDTSGRPSWVTGFLVDGEDAMRWISFGRQSTAAGTVVLTVTASANGGAERTWSIPIKCGLSPRGSVEVVQAGSASAGLPAAPDTPIAVAKDATTVDVSWNKADGATKYKLWRADGGRHEPSDFKLIATQTGTTYTDGKLTPETTYCYKVSAVNAKGETMCPYMASVVTPAKESGGGSSGGGAAPVGELAFGPGNGSRFSISASERAFVVGVSSLTWDRFALRPYQGEQSEDDYSAHSYYTFDDPRLVDAEKNSIREDFDDCWCSALSEMNIFFWTGWIGGYADEDAVKDYMRERAGQVYEDTYGWDFYDLVSPNFSESSHMGVVEGLSQFAKAFETADRLFCLCVDFDSDFIWKGMPGVSHCVVCCGYSLDAAKAVTDPSALRGLFVIDSDNDMYNGAGGASAPDSITYCPVKWNSAARVYEISNVFGATGTFSFDGHSMYYIRTRTAPRMHITEESEQSARTVAFNANGGKSPAASAKYLDGDVYADLPVPTRAGYKFCGWYTDKDAGERVQDGDVVDFSLLDARTPTLYAHWLKAYTLAVKGQDAEATYVDGDGATTSGPSVAVMQGDEVSVAAAEAYFDKNGVEYEFRHWESSKQHDFGEGFDALSSETLLTMPAADVTLTAAYVKSDNAAWISAEATAWSVELGDIEIDPPFDKFQWSVDGKTWYASGATAVVDAGGDGKQKSFSVQWRSLSDVWVAPTGKTTVKVAAGDSAEGVESGEFTFVPAASLAAIVVDGGGWRESAVAGTATMNPKDGKMPSGKALTFTAKANKGYAFLGWVLLLPDWDWPNPLFVSVQSTYKTDALDAVFVDEGDLKVHYGAVFKALSDYSASDMKSAFGKVYDLSANGVDVVYGSAGASVDLAAVVGCSTCFDVLSGCSPLCLPLAFKADGKLPPGLKFDAKTGIVSGNPTSPGDFAFTVTATDPAGNKCRLAMNISVSKPAGDVAGEFRSMLRDSDTGLPAGLLELSVASSGKVSGKITAASGTTSIKPWLECHDPYAPGSASSFAVSYWKSSGNAKSGSQELLVADFGSGEVTYSAEKWSAKDGRSSTLLSGSLLHVDETAFGNAEYKAAFAGRYYTAVLEPDEADAPSGFRTPDELIAPGYLTIAVDKKCGAKVSGKLPDGTSLSASGALLPLDDLSGAKMLLFVAPSAYKKSGCAALELSIGTDGSVSAEDGAWTVPALYAAPAEDFEGDAETLPGMLALSAYGSAYGEFGGVEEYYLSLEAQDPGAMLEYSYTDSGKAKVYETVEAVSDFGLLGSPEITFAKGKVSVGKSPKIWKDSEGYYHYDETKEDRSGNTEEITNPAELSMSFKKATGVFSGKFNIYFDYETPKYGRNGDETYVANHKSVSVPYAGVVVIDEGGSPLGAGSGQYAGKFTLEYDDARGKPKTKTYSKTWAIGLILGF